MFYARAAIVQPMESVPGRTGEVCTKFNANLRIFKKFQEEDPSMGNLMTISGEIVECFHTGEDPLDAGADVLAFQSVDEVWITECPYI